MGWRGMGWRGRGEGGSGRGTRVNPGLIHVNVWQKPLQYCKVISLQLIEINGKRKNHQKAKKKEKEKKSLRCILSKVRKKKSFNYLIMLNEV